MNSFQKFMTGRYGMDALSNLLIILSVVFFFISLFVPVGMFRMFFYLPIILCLYRAFSKNINRRRIELYQFQKYRNLFAYYRKTLTLRLAERKTHKRFRCPQCSQSLRVPKGKGKIEISCPKCKTKFIKET